MDTEALNTFHFLRPYWLLALVPAGYIGWSLYRRSDAAGAWKPLIAKHLLPHLLDQRGARASRAKPHVLLSVLMFLGILAVAGPTWQREPSPFVADNAALVIAVEVTPTMLAEDIQPSRLTRSVQKISDLLDARQGSPTSLIAYAGSAHLVMPLTKDARVITAFAKELHPDQMPAEGDAPSQAIKLGQDLLASSGLGGAVLLVTDGVSPDELQLITDARAQGAPVVHVYGIGREPGVSGTRGGNPGPPLDQKGLRAVAQTGGGTLTVATPDEADIERLARAVATNFSAATPRAGDSTRWRDVGYWVMPLLAIGILMWFRPGWVVQRGTTVLLAALIITPCQVRAEEERVSLGWWATVLLTPDQHGQRLYEQGDFLGAAEWFADPMRRGTALYRAGAFEDAAVSFGQLSSPEATYNRGNALLMLGQYSEAILCYDSALQQRPAWDAARVNRELAQSRRQRLEPPEDAEAKAELSKDDAADEIVFDDRAKNNPKAQKDVVEGTGEFMTDESARALWLRNITTQPGDFLRSKFAYQYAQRRLEPAHDP